MTAMATGIISKVFPHHKPPLGAIRVLTPLRLRGRELDFSYEDVDLPLRDKQYLAVGMIMDISIESCRATNLKPAPVAEYQGSVVRVPQARSSGHGFIVSLDLTLTHVKISADSYNNLKLESPPVPGDFCKVNIAWSEMLLATKENRIILADIVSLLRRPPRVSANECFATSQYSDDDSESELIAELTYRENSKSRTYDERCSSSESLADEFPSSMYRVRQRSRSEDDWTRIRDSNRSSNVYSPVYSQYSEYDHFFQAMMRTSTTTCVRETHGLSAVDDTQISTENTFGSCRPTHLTSIPFSHHYPCLSPSQPLPYQTSYGHFPMCRAHGYIL